MNVRLAWFPIGHAEGAVGNALKTNLKPALLVSFWYLAPFLKEQRNYVYRDWALDSGAFSAHNSGVTINLQEYIETCQRLKKEDSTLSEIFALDVIGDWKASLRNTEKMWEAGVEAIPCYHAGEPESALLHIAKNYPKIALGGVARAKGSKKIAWAGQCFARVWPKRIHGFGYSARDQVMAYPWHSVDATNWELGPCAFGRWASFGKMSVRGSSQNLRSEVEYYLKLEREANSRWAKEMKMLEDEGGAKIRLAAGMSGRSGQVYREAFGGPNVLPGKDSDDQRGPLPPETV